jgi:hypothetical protein
MLKNSLVAVLVTLSNAWPALAQPVAPGQEILIPAHPVQVSDDATRSLELSAGGQSLSAGFSNWRDLTLRGSYGVPRHLFQGEVSLNRRFDQNGAFAGVSDT